MAPADLPDDTSLSRVSKSTDDQELPVQENTHATNFIFGLRVAHQLEPPAGSSHRKVSEHSDIGNSSGLAGTGIASSANTANQFWNVTRA